MSDLLTLTVEELLQAEWMDGWGGDEKDELFFEKACDISWSWLEDFERGQRTPVWVSWNEEENRWRLYNGHHRLTAAILLFWDTMIATTTGDSYGRKKDQTWAIRGRSIINDL